MASFTMDKEILGSVPALSLAFSNKKKLPHYHKGITMGFTFKEELFLQDEIKHLLQKKCDIRGDIQVYIQ